MRLLNKVVAVIVFASKVIAESLIGGSTGLTTLETAMLAVNVCLGG